MAVVAPQSPQCPSIGACSSPAASSADEPQVCAVQSLRVRNTFIDTSAQRSPSLERFYREREVHTCPSNQVGKLRDALWRYAEVHEEEPAAAQSGPADSDSVHAKRSLAHAPSVSSLLTCDTDANSSSGCPSLGSSRDVYAAEAGLQPPTPASLHPATPRGEPGVASEFSSPLGLNPSAAAFVAAPPRPLVAGPAFSAGVPPHSPAVLSLADALPSCRDGVAHERAHMRHPMSEGYY